MYQIITERLFEIFLQLYPCLLLSIGLVPYKSFELSYVYFDVQVLISHGEQKDHLCIEIPKIMCFSFYMLLVIQF